MIQRTRNYLKTLGKFVGPGFMIAVGYLDPGNWATDMEGGSSFGYRLLFVILISNVIAVFLQNLTIRLGTVSGLDLAAASRKHFHRYLNFFLYVLAEIAIIATDIAEVIGSAIALNLLFPKLPLPAGVAITAVDVFIILLFYNEEASDSDTPDSNSDSASLRMVRFFEMFVMMLVSAVGICFIIELTYSDIVAVDVFKGFIPTKEIFADPEILYVAIGIIGATVMPHNLYLHSFIVQARCREWRCERPRIVKNGDHWLIKSNPFTSEVKEKNELAQSDKKDLTTLDDNLSCASRTGDIDMDALQKFLSTSLKRNLHYSFIDLAVALTFAFFINCAILIVASANFYYSSSGNQQQVEDLFSAHALLREYLGPPAAIVFALALLCAGQSSTLTATLAGQVIMSGFLGMTTRPWVRRIITRLIAITPAMIAACLAGRSGLSNMLVASQVALSIQLPFAVVPLIYFTAKEKAMKLELVVEAKSMEPELISTVDQSKMSLIDRTFARLRFSHSRSDWIRFPQFSKVNIHSIKKYCFRQNQESPNQHDTADKQDMSEKALGVLKSWPEPLTYPNGLICNIVAILIALLLIGLNGYLVVSLFLQI
ncbi:natural resistance-associated macrophage protein-domain-containing protein [Blakeslea trispora]|nr:natural resistance-associated macrophage protein-domain-containing protein [Blakeslea trispora]